jgi:hypothetical protein
MVRINLLPEQDPKNWILLEKIIWVVGLALPLPSFFGQSWWLIQNSFLPRRPES